MREAVGAAIPLAGVGCAIARRPLAQLAAMEDGRPFAGGSMTEDYEVGLKIGVLGLRTMFVRIPARPGDRGVVASRGHFPATLGAAVRQKARWLGGIALAGWDRLGWSGGIGERWMRLRDRRGPLAALAPARRLRSGAAVVADLACRSARRADQGAARSCTDHSVDDQRLVAPVANPDARRLHRLGLRVSRRFVLDPEAGRRQCDCDAGGGPGGFAACRRRRQALGQDAAHLPGRASAMRPSLRFLGACGDRLGRAARRRPRRASRARKSSRSSAAKPKRRRSFRPNSHRSSRSPPRFRATPRPILHRPPCATAAQVPPIPVPVYYRGRFPADFAGERSASQRPALAGSAILLRNSAAQRVAGGEHRVGGRCRRCARAWSVPGKARRSRFAKTPRSTPADAPGPCFVRSKAEFPARDRWRRAERSVQARPGRGSITISRAQIAATFRTTSEVGRRGGEVAAGMRIQPVGGIPVWFTAERRQRLGKYGGGRNAFAMFLEGGVYNRPMPWQFSLDAYLEGGVVGFHQPRSLHRRRADPDPPGVQAILGRPRRVGRRSARRLSASMPVRESACVSAIMCACTSIGVSGSPAMPRPARVRRSPWREISERRRLAVHVVCG